MAWSAIRDWLYVEDIAGDLAVLRKGRMAKSTHWRNRSLPNLTWCGECWS